MKYLVRELLEEGSIMNDLQEALILPHATSSFGAIWRIKSSVRHLHRWKYFVRESKKSFVCQRKIHSLVIGRSVKATRQRALTCVECNGGMLIRGYMYNYLLQCIFILVHYPFLVTLSCLLFVDICTDSHREMYLQYFFFENRV